MLQKACFLIRHPYDIYDVYGLFNFIMINERFLTRNQMNNELILKSRAASNYSMSCSAFIICKYRIAGLFIGRNCLNMSTSSSHSSFSDGINLRRLSEGKLVLFGIIAMIAAFAILLIFVSGGGVRHVPITWKEKVEATIAFRNVNGKAEVVGLKGITQINPTLVSRTGDTAYILTIINQNLGSPHMFYIDGINAHTKILRPWENDTITIYSKSQGTYNYYDRLDAGINGTEIKPLGQFMAVKVGDE